MGNLHSLLASKPSQDVLEAAEAGDVACLKEKIACEPRLVDSVTLLKRRGVLHLAAKHGHAAVITTVLEPFIAAVREEYYAQLTPAEAQKVPEECEQQLQPQEQQQAQLPSQQQQQQTEQQQQQQQQQTEAQFSESSRTGSMGTTPQPAQRRPQQHSEPHLASFKRLRSAVNARDLYRRTPLIIAAKKGHLHCVQLLLDSAANMFAVDREGNTYATGCC
jgi:cobalamin biosynthesis Mg chelatase CobN